MSDSKTLGRRDFLRRTGWMAAGVTVLAACGPLRRVLPAMPVFRDPLPEDGLAWVQALPDGKIRFFCPRMEMGQGASLGLSQVVGEELNVPQDRIECVLPHTDQSPPFKMTVGSESIERFFEPVSLGAAGLREALRGRAAAKFGSSAEEIQDSIGGFTSPDGMRIDYSFLVHTEALILTAEDAPAPARYTVSRSGNYRALGQSWPHHDLEAIVTGRAVYSRDVMVPGMLFGAAVRPPALGAVLVDADVAAAREISGVADVFFDRKSRFAGVVCENSSALAVALEALDPEWELAEPIDTPTIEKQLDIDKHRKGGVFEHEPVSSGSSGVGMAESHTLVEARYDTPFASHAQIEPRAAVVWVRDDSVEVWCGSQDPYFVRRRVAKALGRSNSDIIVHSLRMGGGFGGRVLCWAAEEAAVLSAKSGRPVRVEWDRTAEFRNNYFQPAFSHWVHAGADTDGIIRLWLHDFVSSPILTGPFSFMGAVEETVAAAIDAVLADEGTARGSTPHYRVAHRKIRYSDIRTRVPVGAWRGLGAGPNTFAIESMIDELAAAAGIDPFDFRLRNLPPESARLAKVLRDVADLCAWNSAGDRALGIACAVYKEVTPVAVAVEVEIDHPGERILVRRVWCAQDCGLVINPDQVKNLVAGNVVWGCSMALMERITFVDGAVQESNFDTYGILRNADAPDITVKLIQSDAPPSAVGEAALGPVAPAIANAIFAATGRRFRKLPISYADLKSPDPD